MPCYDPETDLRPKRMEKKLYLLTSLLCYSCGILEKNFSDALASNPELSNWWNKHKTHDARVEAIREKSQLLGDAALSPTERGILYTANDISY